ncbi:cupin [Rhizobium sp. CFBP 8762]|uniref:cupin n=1 Tax=Rhizobium sp. CFBP 8762 TaxID=2775279 RepID=UPI00177F1AF0|nr:cupin [Rhizobium sp. CFBP 8762]MBD8553934.1 cupin [Rhizobium sp. CFBP 8762]
MIVDTVWFDPSGHIPNNRELPVILYQQALPLQADMTRAFETRFAGNKWGDQWRNGVFDYQHYHTTAHEVLGIAAGNARLLIGGPDGKVLTVNAGDCVLLPAGTGHCRLEASRDFLVVGAYPAGQHADLKTGPASMVDMQTITRLPMPDRDPIEGKNGPLLHHWIKG